MQTIACRIVRVGALVAALRPGFELAAGVAAGAAIGRLVFSGPAGIELALSPVCAVGLGGAAIWLTVPTFVRETISLIRPRVREAPAGT
jgi:hypothetical protein